MERTDFEQWKSREVARLLALVETERRYYQEMVASLPVALVVLAADRSIISANRAFRHTFGLKTEDMRRKTIEQILPAPSLVEKIRDVHVHGTTLPHVFIDLDERTLRIAIVPIRNWDEESEIETLLMLEDVSSLRAPAPPVVHRPEPVVIPEPEPVPVPEPVVIHAPAVDVPAVVWEADAGTLAFTSVNGAAEGMLGYPVSHWLSTPNFFRERMHAEDRAATMKLYESAMERESGASAEYRVVASSGAVIWCRETMRVTAKGVITGILTDITLRRQLEEQLLTAGRFDAINGLASKLAHDLNNPLMIITGYGEEILQMLAPGDPIRGDVAQILGATQRISGITGRLLGYTRRVSIAPQPVNVLALLAGLEENLAHAAGEGVAVEIHAENQPVWAMADSAQLSEAILTLVAPGRTDAEDAKERSRVAITCSMETIADAVPGATLAPGKYAHLIVQDDGRGMDAAARQSAFEAIFSGKDALARAYANVRGWGGDIALASEPFRGSVFHIYLPYHDAPPPPPVVEKNAEPVAETKPPDGGDTQTGAPAAPEVVPLQTIMLVEDEPGIRALVRKILRRERFGVLEAGTGEEALKMSAAQLGHVDLLLTDVMLPGMGGRELAETMRARRPDMKILYISGYTSDEAVRAGTFPPGSKFLQKPFTLSALVNKVRDALADPGVQ
jgi:PAS domain S-box-containing protein